MKSETETNVKLVEKTTMKRPESMKNAAGKRKEEKDASQELYKPVINRTKSPTGAKRVEISLLSPNRSQSVSVRNPAKTSTNGTVKVHRDGQITERMLRYQKIYEEKRKELQEQREKDVIEM